MTDHRSDAAPTGSILFFNYHGVMGGSEVVLHQLCTAATEHGWRTHFASITEGNAIDEFEAAGATIHRLRPHRSRQVHRVLQAGLQLRRIVAEHDIDVVHANGGLGLIYGGPACRSTSARLLWHVHDPFDAGTAHERVAARVQRWICPDHAVFTTETVATSIRGWHPRLAHTSVIAPGVAVPATPPPPTPDSGPPSIAMFARVQEHKGHATLIDAAAALRARGHDFHLDIVGGALAGDSGLERDLQAKVAALGLDERTTFHGYVSKDRRDELMQRAAVVVHPASSETFGLVVAEAMAAGIPVVAAAAPGPSKLIEDGRSGLLAAVGDAEDLADKIDRVLTDAALARELGRAARRRVIERFSLPVMTSSFMSLYENLIDQHRPGSSAA